MELFKLICGRYVSPAQLTLFFDGGDGNAVDSRKRQKLEEKPTSESLATVATSIHPPNSIREVFTFSPFGLSCQHCVPNVMIVMEERYILRHLKKHGIESHASNVRSLIDGYQKQMESAKLSGTIDPYRVDGITHTGYSCTCGQHFPLRKDSAVRHCQKAGCDASMIQKVNLIKLCCGRYVMEAQVARFFTPCISQQFNYMR